MRVTLVWIIGALSVACMNPVWADDGETLFKTNGCMSCHKLESNSKTNPSLTDISHAYQGKAEQLKKYLRGNSEPIVKPDKGILMKRQIEKTKNLSDAELESLVNYMLSVR